MKGSYERKFWQVLEDLFVGAEVEGKGGYINLLKVKRQYFKNYLSGKLKEYIQETLKDFPTFKEELYDKLYTFFRRYFSEIGSIMLAYTPLYYKIYEKVYDNDKQELKELITYNTDYEQILSEKQDVALFWKTRNLYYIKTDRIVRSMKVEVDNTSFYFDASEVEHKKNNEKRSFVYELAGIENNTVVLKVKYTERGTKTKEEEIIKQAKKQGKPITEETLRKAIRTFEKQVYVDYFINKNAEKFLKEQFDLWLYQYLFSQETNFSYDRFRKLQVLKNVAYRIIEFVAQFEDELRKLWEKPRLVFNSNYVISLDRLASKEYELVKRIIADEGMKEQVKEWIELGLVDEDFKPEDVLSEGSLNPKYQFLPVDTKYFEWLKEEIENLFDVYSVDGDLDGWLIKSENWQALNTILPRFREKVQTIYIDPPFKTGKDFFYEDKFRDSSWLTLMENRLQLAKDFLNKQGSIFVHLDWNANFLGRYLLESLFSEIIEIVWNTNATKDEESGLFQYKSFGKKYVRQHDTIFQCAKTQDYKFFKLWKPNRRTTRLSIGWLDLISYPRISNPQSLEDYEFYIEKYNDENKLKLQKLEINEKIFPIGDIWNDIYSFTQSELRVSENVSFDTQKPENLLRRIIQSTSEQGDIVMDFFAGSGTTIVVAHKLRRKWIGVEASDCFNEFYSDGGEKKIGLLGRMKIVLSGDKKFLAIDKQRRSHLSQDINWQGGGFFKYYELEQYEDILRVVEYKDTDVREYYEKLKEVLGEDFVFSKASPFVFDLPWQKAVRIENGDLRIHFEELYPDKQVDIKETLANRCLESEIELLRSFLT